LQQRSPEKHHREPDFHYADFTKKMWHPDTNTITGEAVKHKNRFAGDIVLRKAPD
jgi:hypothetical protein